MAIQYFKVILPNAQGIDAGDKKLRSPHVLKRGGKTVDALKEMLRDECVPFNEDYSGNCKLKQPYVYRVRKFLQIDFQKLFPDQTTSDHQAQRRRMSVSLRSSELRRLPFDAEDFVNVPDVVGWKAS